MLANNCLNGNVQSSSLVLDVDNNSSGNESLQFVGVKTPAPKVVDPALEGTKLDRVQKRAGGELAFCGDAQAIKLYKRLVPGYLSLPFVTNFQRTFHRTTYCSFDHDDPSREDKLRM